MASTKKENDLPLLSIQELIDDISERFPHLGISISDLNLPSSELVKNILRAYLDETFHGNISQHISDHEMHPDIHPEVYQLVLPISNLHYAFSIILKVSGDQSFTISDITNPTPKRTQQILALIENFAKFYEMKTIPLFGRVKKREESYKSMFAQNEQLRHELNSRATNRAQREVNSEELLEEQKQKKITIEDLLKKQKVLAEKKEVIEYQVYETKQKCESLSQECHNIGKQNSNLSKQVVPNTDELTNKVADLNQQLSLKMEAVKEKEKDLQFIKANINQLESIAENQKNATKMLQEVLKLTTSQQAKSNDLQKKESELKTTKNNIQGDQDKLTMKQESNIKLQDHIVGLKLQEDTKASQRTKSLTVLNKETLNLKTNHDDLLRRFTDLEKELNKSHENLKQQEETKVKLGKHAEKLFNRIVTEQEKFDKDIEQETLNEINRLELLLRRSKME